MIRSFHVFAILVAGLTIANPALADDPPPPKSECTPPYRYYAKIAPDEDGKATLFANRWMVDTKAPGLPMRWTGVKILANDPRVKFSEARGAAVSAEDAAARLKSPTPILVAMPLDPFQAAAMKPDALVLSIPLELWPLNGPATEPNLPAPKSSQEGQLVLAKAESGADGKPVLVMHVPDADIVKEARVVVKEVSVTELVNGIPVTKVVTVNENVLTDVVKMKWRVQRVPLGDPQVKFTDVQGKAVDTLAAAVKLGQRVPIVIHTEAVDPFFLTSLRPETLVLVAPEAMLFPPDAKDAK